MADRRLDQITNVVTAPAGTDIFFIEEDPAAAKTPGKITTTDLVGGMVFCVKSGTYPTRPDTTAPVIFIGDTDPSGSALTNDIWIDNS